MDESPMEKLLETPDLAGALGSDRFKQFLDHVPVGIAVAEVAPAERVVYANPGFERLTGVRVAEVRARISTGASAGFCLR